MKENKKILVGVPPKHHILLATDEIDGLREIGYICWPVRYGRNAESISKINRLIGVIVNALNIVVSLYRYSPNLLYLNSRFEPLASTRDFITILLVRILYIKKLGVIIKSHGSDISFLLDQSFFYKNIVVPFLTNQVDKWLFLSQEEKTDIMKLNPVLAGRISVTANIIDPKRAVSSSAFKRKYGLDFGKVNFLYAGRMIKEKGIFSLLQSIPLVKSRDKCKFILVGDGPDLEELKKLANKLNITEYILFAGFIPDSECDLFYGNTDVLVYPTFANEGFPMALFKSVAAGLPVLTTNIRAAKDHLKSPDNVLWVNGESPESVSEAIEEIYSNHQLRKIMAHNNKLLGETFTRRNVCMEMSKAFSSVKLDKYN